MRRFFHIKGLAFLFTLAAHVCFSALPRHAAALYYIPVPEKHPPPPVTSWQPPPSSPFFVQTHTEPLLHKNSLPAPEKLKKLGETMQKLSHVTLNKKLKAVAPKNPHKSARKCARYVVAGLNAVGLPVKRADAKNMPPLLLEGGFEKIDVEKGYIPFPGDVSIIAPPNKEHPHGHMSVFCADGHWYSDHRQPKKNLGQKKEYLGAWVYGSDPKENLMTFYRHGGLFSSQNAYTLAVNPAYFTSYKLAALQPFDQMGALKKKTKDISLFDQQPYTVTAPLLLTSSLGEEKFTETYGKGIDQDFDAFGGIKGRGAKNLSRTIPVRLREEKKEGAFSTQQAVLKEEWRRARQAVLQRNAAEKKGETDKTANAKLRSGLKNMYVCLPKVMAENPVEAFKAARYILNKRDDKSLFSPQNKSIKRRVLLELIRDHLHEIYAHDTALARQAATFVFNKAGKGPLRESVRGLFAPLPLDRIPA